MNAARTVTAAIAAAAITLTGQPAHASDTHHLTLACHTGGTTVTVSIDYASDGYNARYWNAHWTTTPKTKLDRIDLGQNPWLNNNSYTTFWARGGKPSTRNDVKAKGGKNSFIAAVQAGNDVPEIRVRLRAWGGKGNSDDSCATSKPLKFTS
ncbi:hypothetical protein [Kineosporia babensis]|uniref:Secreted protein n=1 Tax=Kineosporia babensis TaxID=499548 RepID=A0A9X1NB41_9ACTN|nr:hypothetical protein [Kineosporia babensis]MCD5310850.1 hypothetical protein [Kineosporia babensis]